MSIDIYWRIGTHGDQPSLRRRVTSRGEWAPVVPGSLAPGVRHGRRDGYSYVEHMADVARASEVSGFVGGLLPSFPFTDDPWATAAALARETTTYRFMIAYQPGFLHPVQAARMSATLQRATGGRLVYNIISGGGGPAQLWWGDRVDHDDRYARTSEFLDVLKGVWNGGPFDYEGRFYRVEGAGLPEPLARQPFPEIYFSGSSKAAIEAAGRHADYYLSWLEPFPDLAAKFAQVREHSAALGTAPKFAVRIDVLARETEEAAWDEIRRGWEHVDPSALASADGDSVGWLRSQSFVSWPVRHHRELEVSPNVWGGFHLLRGGPAFGLVGSYAQVAERLDELIGLGVGAFILAGVPHLEEAYRVGEEVLPLLKGHDVRVASPLTAALSDSRA
ncbi:alkanesulfonate monooxygenase [Sphaerisporangium krabiense]|uniref:Alkanesulfonate monooxygenase n=1 Tax=Sphaerisporangium krabiense TaxID=763782 RepID=A0A7W8Z7I0_9ACTN|nr:LLM class flavin-dependent oxidoreductase [Sphaerisporangium krabiense]MBB5628934.1 alkanesulfonate monooxygenase [Sphaerisporangium krabiense]GII60225.1 alkanesulfonate monooxygenase [Sphaerisporangium krabiense]